MKLPDPGRAWAYVGAVVGGGVSVAANIAHSYVKPDDGWKNGAGPEPGAVGFAIFWPLALLVAVEIFSRTTWRDGWRWSALRYGGLLPLAGVAAFVSYRHLSGLLTYYGEEPVTQYVGPLAVDGLMLLATSALLATSLPQAETSGAVVVPEPATVPAAAPEPVVVVDEAGVGDYVAAASIPGEPKRLTAAKRRRPAGNRERALALKSEGLKNSEIARELGVKPQTVTGYLKPEPVNA